MYWSPSATWVATHVRWPGGNFVSAITGADSSTGRDGPSERSWPGAGGIQSLRHRRVHGLGRGVWFRTNDGQLEETYNLAEVNADKPDAVNSFEQPDNVAVRRAVREVHGSHLDVTFAPHSFTVCEVSLA